MSIFARYFLWSFFVRFGQTLAGLTVILLVFDVIVNTAEIVNGGGGFVLPLLIYSGLRLPEIVSLLVPLAVLLAAMIIFSQYAAHGEMTAFQAAGVSIYRIVGNLLLATGVVAGAHFWFANGILPETAGRLRLWAELDYRSLPPKGSPNHAPTWFAAGDALVHTVYSSLDGRKLYGLTVVRRDEEGRMTDYFTARQAIFSAGRWRFEGVKRPATVAGQEDRGEQVVLDLPISPSRFSKLAAPLEELAFADLLEIRRQPPLGERPPHVYALWLQRKLAQPGASLVMVLLAAPLGLLLARRNLMLLASFAVVSTGFLFFIAERFLLTLGEDGLLPSFVAVWGPMILFASLALWILLNLQD